MPTAETPEAPESAETPEGADAVPVRSLPDTEPQTAGSKVLLHFTMSLDGFVAGPEHAMDWMTGISHRSGLVEEYVETTGAVLGGRDGWDGSPDAEAIYGGAWQGPVFVLTRHPQDAHPAGGVTFLSCDVAEAGPDRARGRRLPHRGRRSGLAHQP
ncbi:hypothetical protein GCM10027073_43710 [Streptomyces chlorus]|uniref:Dihydrofolate reductase family protein n=1 Tax=Streptomyces chlorus TaxID=887452 RepID=A0ABW1E495_9ACTN